MTARVSDRWCATPARGADGVGSDLTLLPLQDVFGWRDRINEPGTVNDRNWTFRLPWPVDRLDEMPEARERQASCARGPEKHGRYNRAMATLSTVSCATSDAVGRARRRRRSLRRRQRRRGARAGRRQPAELPARLARRNRSAARTPIPTPTRSTPAPSQNFAALKATAARRRGRAGAVRLPAARWAATSRPGVAGCFSLDEYDRDLIKKHERTRRDKEDDRTRHMLELGAQTGPGVPDLSRVRRRRRCDRHACDRGRAAVRLRGGRRRPSHDLARRAARDRDALVAAFARDAGAVHRRRPSSRRERRARRDAIRDRGTARPSLGDGADCNTFLAVAFPHDQVQILPYNRIVKDLAG